MRQSLKIAFHVCFFLLIILTYSASAERSLSEQLKQLVSDLQKNPDDFALREKIIKLVQEMKPQPAVPEEAERYFARGRAAVKSASTAKDFEDAANEFNKALMIAPWLAEGYYNLGIVQDKAGKYQDAIRSLKLYLLSAPNAPDVKEVKSLIFEIEYRQEKTQKETAAKKKEEETKPDFSGVWGKNGWCWRYKFIISGRELTITGECVEAYSTFLWGTGTVEGRNFEGTCPGIKFPDSGGIPRQSFKGSLSEDNRTITISIGKWPTDTWTRVSK